MNPASWNPILPVLVSCIAILVAIITGYQNRRLSRQIARKQGVFRTPNVRVSAYGIEQVEGQQHLFIIGCPNLPAAFPFPITISNGEKVAKSVKLLTRFPRALRGSDPSAVFKVTRPSNIGVDFLPDGNYQITVTTIGTLTPFERLAVKDLVFLSGSTITSSEVATRTKDDIGVRMTVKAWFTYRIDFTVYHEDEQPMAGRINLMVLDTSGETLADALAKYNIAAKQAYRKEVGGSFAQIIHYYKLRIRQQDVTRPVHVVLCEQSGSTSSEIGDVKTAPEPLKMFHGREFINGEIYVSGING
jgi:hypothetical protein